MIKDQLNGVQGQPGPQLTRGTPMASVSHDGVARLGGVDADLVGAPGLERGFN